MHDCKYKEVLLFAFLDVKLWLKKGDYKIPKYSFRLIYSISESIDFFQSLFYIQYSKTGNSYLSGINNNQTFHTCISDFDSPLVLWEESSNFNPLGFEPKRAFSHNKTCKIKSHLELQNSAWTKRVWFMAEKLHRLFDLVQRHLNWTLVMKN